LSTNNTQELLDDIYTAIIDGDAGKVTAGVQAALEKEADPGQILNESMIEAMAEVGRMFEEQECFVPEMLIAARAMKAGMEILRPHLVAADIQPIGKVVLGTVHGDLHDIGKNLVGMMLEGAGFEVIDLGVDVPPQRFLEAVFEHQPSLVGMSALLTTTMGSMHKTVQTIKEAGLPNQPGIMIGGAPVTEDFAQQIGADLFAPDASTASKRAKGWLEKA
jgi:5-methyltetrahydrofolate--homocysteine methyltransferase